MSISRDTIYTIQMLSGTSSDEKPTDVKSGSTFKEIDTGKTYIFDGTTWVLQPGGGGASDPVLENAKSTGGIGWTEQGEQVLFDGDLLIDQPTPASGAVYSPIDIDSLEVGQTYNIKWNGVDYACECTDGGEVIFLGNPSIMGLQLETDEPFFIGFEDIGGPTVVATMSAGTYSIKVSKDGETVHKIDEKYLPASGGGAMVVNFDYDGTTDSYVSDKSFAEILSAYPNVYGSHYGGEEIYYVQGNDGDDSINFVTFIATDTALYINQWTVYADDSVEHIDREIRFSQS